MKTQTKSRALLLVCVLLIVTALVAVFAVSASATAAVTELNDYALVLSDGVDIKVTGTVAEADLEKEIKVVTTCHGEVTYDIEVVDGAFSVVIPVSATRYADAVRVDLVVDGTVVDTQQVSINSYVAAILADSEASDDLKVIVSEVIRYGVAVLNKLGATDDAAALAAELELADSIEPTWNPDFTYDKGEAVDGGINIIKVGMELDARLNLIITADAPIGDYTVVADGYEVVPVDGDPNSVKVVGIPVSKLFAKITVGAYNGDDLVSNKVSISPCTYYMLYSKSLAAKYDDIANATADEKADMSILQNLVMYAAIAHEMTDHNEVVTTQVATCQATGLKTTACAGCGYKVEETLEIDAATHSEISYTVANNAITYTCAGCEKTWTSTTLMLADGTSTSMLSGNPSTNSGFVGGSTGFPNMVDGHYEFVKAETPATSQGQFRLVKSVTGTTPSGASVVANRLGFISISMKAVDVPVVNPDDGSSWQLNLANNESGSQWGTVKGQAKGFPVLDGVPGDGSKAKTPNGVEITLADDAFTRIDISFVPVENDMYLLTYYVDGKIVDVVTVDNILFNYTPHCLYFTCKATYDTTENAVQPSVVFDDVTLAFTDGTASDFFPTNHVHAAGSETVKIDDATHGVKCSGCDVYVSTAKHDYDFSGATCASGAEATGTCTCGATATKTIEHTLVATGYADNTVTYACKVCSKAYTLAATKGSDCSTGLVFGANDIDTSASGTADGVYTFCNSSTASNSNAIVCAYPGIDSKTIFVGFDIKNTETRGGYFQTQWRTPPNNWGFNSADTLRLEIKPDGSIYFGQNHEDTGLDISTTEFTSILMKATFTEEGENTTLTVDLWVNGQHVGTSSVTIASKNHTWQDASGAGLQICLQNNTKSGDLSTYVGVNSVVLDNVFVGTTEATGTDITAYLTAK